jgi:hypothetical protein
MARIAPGYAIDSYLLYTTAACSTDDPAWATPEDPSLAVGDLPDAGARLRSMLTPILPAGAMPPNSPDPATIGVSASEIRTIRAWIDNGATDGTNCPTP